MRNDPAARDSTGSWWEDASPGRRDCDQNGFTTYTDRRRGLTRGDDGRFHRAPGDAGSAGRHTSSALGYPEEVAEAHLHDDREPSKYERRASVSANTSWWDNTGSNERYGSSGSFETLRSDEEEENEMFN